METNKNTHHSSHANSLAYVIIGGLAAWIAVTFLDGAWSLAKYLILIALTLVGVWYLFF